MIYVVMFVSSTGLFYLSDKCQGLLRRLLLAIALIMPCLLAAVRGLDIGTDVMTYGVWTYRSASRMDLIPFLESYADVSPLGFNLMSWLVANSARSFELYLGVIQLLTILPIYLAVKRLFPGREWLCMLCYFLILYPMSLNMMKQSIAVAICLFATTYAIGRRPLNYVVTICLACLFHQTAFVAAITYPILALVIGGNRKSTLFGRWRPLMLVAIAVIALGSIFVFGRQLVLFFSQFRDSYSYQVEHIGRGGTIESVIVTAVFAAAIWWMCRSFIVGSTPRIGTASNGVVPKPTAAYDFFFCLFLLGCILMQLDVVSDSVGRLGYYFLPYIGLFASSIAFDSEKRCHGAVFCLIALLLFYFIFTYIIRGGAEVYPFITFDGRVRP